MIRSFGRELLRRQKLEQLSQLLSVCGNTADDATQVKIPLLLSACKNAIGSGRRDIAEAYLRDVVLLADKHGALNADWLYLGGNYIFV